MKILEHISPSCVYCILNMETGKMYFGYTKNFHKRSREHLNDLKNDRHHNIYLQRVYNKKQELSIFPVEYCDVLLLPEREKFWITHHNSTSRGIGYNLTSGGEDLLTLSLDAQIRKADGRRGKPGSLKGRKQSKEHVLNRSLATKGISKPMSQKTLEAVKLARMKAIGTIHSGIPLKITNTKTGESLMIDSLRRAAPMFHLNEKQLVNKFYKGRSKVKLHTIIIDNFILEKNVQLHP